MLMQGSLVGYIRSQKQFAHITQHLSSTHLDPQPFKKNHSISQCHPTLVSHVTFLFPFKSRMLYLPKQYTVPKDKCTRKPPTTAIHPFKLETSYFCFVTGELIILMSSFFGVQYIFQQLLLHLNMFCSE